MAAGCSWFPPQLRSACAPQQTALPGTIAASTSRIEAELFLADRHPRRCFFAAGLGLLSWHIRPRLRFPVQPEAGGKGRCCGRQYPQADEDQVTGHPEPLDEPNHPLI